MGDGSRILVSPRARDQEKDRRWALLELATALTLADRAPEAAYLSVGLPSKAVASVLVGVALAHLRRDRPSPALRAVTRLATVGPELWRRMGEVLLLLGASELAPSESAQLLRLATSHQAEWADSAEAATILAQAQVRAGKLQNALDTISGSAERASESAPQRFVAAQALWGLDRRDEARAAYEAGVKLLDGDHPPARGIRAVQATAARLLGLAPP